MVKFQLCNKAEVSLLDWYEKNGYLASEKKDGTRCIAIIENNKVILKGRSGYTYENKFPEICEELIKIFPDNTIIDGELCCGTFQQIQSRTLTQDKNKIAELIKKYPAKFYVFDILMLENKDLTNLKLSERLTILGTYFSITSPVFRRHIGSNEVVFVEHTSKIKELWEKAQKEKWEGICIKNVNSIYQNRRSNDWLKLKCVKRRVIEFEKYTLNNAGVRAESKEGIAVQISGHQSKKFIELHNKNKKVSVEVEFLEEFESGAIRQGVCKEVLE